IMRPVPTCSAYSVVRSEILSGNSCLLIWEELTLRRARLAQFGTGRRTEAECSASLVHALFGAVGNLHPRADLLEAIGRLINQTLITQRGDHFTGPLPVRPRLAI